MAYESVKKLVQDYPAMQESFAQVSVQFEDKVKTPGISVMVYGIYNAGKSTLINALIGQEVAPTGDIPLTDKVALIAGIITPSSIPLASMRHLLMRR